MPLTVSELQVELELERLGYPSSVAFLLDQMRDGRRRRNTVVWRYAGFSVVPMMASDVITVDNETGNVEHLTCVKLHCRGHLFWNL